MLEYLTQFEDDEDDPVPEMDFSDLTPVDWQEGIEDIRDLSTDDLWNKLGLPDKVLPYFNTTTDPLGSRDPWTDPTFFEDPANVVPFGPRWHQLLGIYRILERVFEGKGVLSMDEVGLGKTLQVVGAFAVLVYFREFYSQHNRFPGAFGESTLNLGDS
jgi:hypothetical protein